MLVAQSRPTLCDPMDCSLTGSLLSVEFSRQEYWSGQTFPSSGDLPNPGIKPGSLTWQVDCSLSEPEGSPESLSHSVVSDSLWPYRLQPDRFLYAWNSPGKNAGVSSHSLPQGCLPYPEIESRSSPALQADSLPSEPLKKPKVMT